MIISPNSQNNWKYFSPVVVVKCQSKKRVEEELNVMLTGDFLGENPILNVSDFIVAPRRHSYASYEDIDGKRSTVMDIKIMLSKTCFLKLQVTDYSVT